MGGRSEFHIGLGNFGTFHGQASASSRIKRLGYLQRLSQRDLQVLSLERNFEFRLFQITLFGSFPMLGTALLMEVEMRAVIMAICAALLCTPIAMTAMAGENSTVFAKHVESVNGNNQQPKISVGDEVASKTCSKDCGDTSGSVECTDNQQCDCACIRHQFANVDERQSSGGLHEIGPKKISKKEASRPLFS